MFSRTHDYSAVTAVLPNTTAGSVIDSLVDEPSANALVWQARGTLLHEQWWKRWVPPIGPSKTMLQAIVPTSEVDRVISTVVERGKLHLQATGAVFSTRCEHIYFGSNFHVWPARGQAQPSAGSARSENLGLNENLSVIFCVVGHDSSDRVAKAAIAAGAHGPIVYYAEGRGLRDRLGWLRITKEHEQEVIMVLADQDDVDEVFDAMAKAGQLHLPGRGFMYRFSIHQGMFNLPSRTAHPQHAANIQQIINAIDHLTGHTHWRDQAVFDVGSEGKSYGVDFLEGRGPALKEQACLAAIVRRDQMSLFVDMLLDAGAPCLNFNYVRFSAAEGVCQIARARINDEYGMIRCVTARDTAERVCAAVDQLAEMIGINDLCMMAHPVAKVATYVPGSRDYRVEPPQAEAAV